LSHYLIERVRETASIEVLYHAEVSALEGDESLRRIQLSNVKTGTAAWVDSEWLFVCIGGAPNTDWASETAIIRDPSGYLVTGSDLFSEGRPPACWTLERQPFFLETSVPGSFAAGAVRHNSVKGVASAVGQGALAVRFVRASRGAGGERRGSDFGRSVNLPRLSLTARPHGRNQIRSTTAVRPRW